MCLTDYLKIQIIELLNDIEDAEMLDFILKLLLAESGE